MVSKVITDQGLILFDLAYGTLSREIYKSYGGLLSTASMAASEWPFGPKGDFAGRTNGRTDIRFKGARYVSVSHLKDECDNPPAPYKAYLRVAKVEW